MSASAVLQLKNFKPQNSAPVTDKKVHLLKTKAGLPFYAGLGDLCTGLLLLFFPIYLLACLGIAVHPEQVFYIRFIGSFVCGVGICYALEYCICLRHGNANGLLPLFRLTALLRLVVAGFILFFLISTPLPVGWMLVAAYDGSVALFQIYLILVGMRHAVC